MIQRFCLVFPLLALFFYIVARDPQLMVKFGGIAQAVTLPMIALVALYFRYRKVDRRLQPWPTTDVLIWIAVLSIVVVGAFAIFDNGRQLFQMLTAPKPVATEVIARRTQERSRRIPEFSPRRETRGGGDSSRRPRRPVAGRPGSRRDLQTSSRAGPSTD